MFTEVVLCIWVYAAYFIEISTKFMLAIFNKIHVSYLYSPGLSIITGENSRLWPAFTLLHSKSGCNNNSVIVKIVMVICKKCLVVFVIAIYIHTRFKLGNCFFVNILFKYVMFICDNYCCILSVKPIKEFMCWMKLIFILTSSAIKYEQNMFSILYEHIFF